MFKYLFLLLFCLSARAGTITLEWNAVQDAREYRLTYGYDIGVSFTQFVGTNNFYKIKNLDPGRHYWFLISSVSTNGTIDIISNYAYYRSRIVKGRAVTNSITLKIREHD